MVVGAGVFMEGEDLPEEEFGEEHGWRSAAEGSNHEEQGYQIAKNAWAAERALEDYRSPYRGDLDVQKTGSAGLGRAIAVAAGIAPELAGQDVVCPNAMQNITVISTASRENADSYLRMSCLTLGIKQYEISTYEAAPHATCKGVIRKIDISESQTDLQRNTRSTIGSMAAATPVADWGIGRMLVRHRTKLSASNAGLAILTRTLRVPRNVGSVVACTLRLTKVESKVYAYTLPFKKPLKLGRTAVTRRNGKQPVQIHIMDGASSDGRPRSRSRGRRRSQSRGRSRSRSRSRDPQGRVRFLSHHEPALQGGTWPDRARNGGRPGGKVTGGTAPEHGLAELNRLRKKNAEIRSIIEPLRAEMAEFRRASTSQPTQACASQSAGSLSPQSTKVPMVMEAGPLGNPAKRKARGILTRLFVRGTTRMILLRVGDRGCRARAEQGEKPESLEQWTEMLLQDVQAVTKTIETDEGSPTERLGAATRGRHSPPHQEWWVNSQGRFHSNLMTLEATGTNNITLQRIDNRSKGERYRLACPEERASPGRRRARALALLRRVEGLPGGACFVDAEEYDNRNRFTVVAINHKGRTINAASGFKVTTDLSGPTVLHLRPSRRRMTRVCRLHTTLSQPLAGVLPTKSGGLDLGPAPSLLTPESFDVQPAKLTVAEPVQPLARPGFLQEKVDGS
ncbi:hypothetical protein HPB50_002680 [Hyalomma asiaticum]|uniref:Uncharacterized protein n=1 Tax=Hyalomma asiaticum TaxID=266040 RepID=A0ACB7TDC8_HYAAI|nr:hypothetical protein HPB50_002680 [Hyalomma asiaticum]